MNNFENFLNWFNELKSIHVINNTNIDAVLERFEN